MTSMSDKKLRPFNCFFSWFGLRTYQHPCRSTLYVSASCCNFQESNSNGRWIERLCFLNRDYSILKHQFHQRRLPVVQHHQHWGDAELPDTSDYRGTLHSLPTSALHNFLSHYINKIQQDATVCRYLFTAKSLHMFQVSIAPIIRST